MYVLEASQLVWPDYEMHEHPDVVYKAPLNARLLKDFLWNSLDGGRKLKKKGTLGKHSEMISGIDIKGVCAI